MCSNRYKTQLLQTAAPCSAPDFGLMLRVLFVPSHICLSLMVTADVLAANSTQKAILASCTARNEREFFFPFLLIFGTIFCSTSDFGSLACRRRSCFICICHNSCLPQGVTRTTYRRSGNFRCQNIVQYWIRENFQIYGILYTVANVIFNDNFCNNKKSCYIILF